VVAHTFEAFGRARNSFDGRPYFLQIPIFRLLLDGGYLAVSIFFVMSGYVCSIKPLKLARAGKAAEARQVIASSAFRRTIRLGIPASFATLCSWLLCQSGGYNVALSLPPHYWLNYMSPRPSDFYSALQRLFNALVSGPINRHFANNLAS
jgi:peptidoglycan/LPS O-acetylase OafA/YrhL